MTAELRGYHVTCDGLAPADVARQWGKQDALDWCNAVVEQVEMTVINGPFVHEAEGVIIGHTIIAESHITVHLKPETGECYAECFSCKPFDRTKFVALTLDAFGISESGGARWFPRSVQ